MFELRSLDYVLKAVERGSFRAAAQELGVSQPAMTKAIQKLETSFGAPLFERQSHGVVPTPFGEAVIRRAREARAVLDSALKEVEALRDGNEGEVTIGANPAWQDCILPEALAEFRVDKPRVRVVVLGAGGWQLRERLKSGGLDFILGATPDEALIDKDLEWKRFHTDHYCIVAGPEHPLRSKELVGPDDLVRFPWVLPDSSSYMVSRLHHTLRAFGLPPPEPRVITESLPLAFSLVRHSDYLTYHSAEHLVRTNNPHIRPLEVQGMKAVRMAGRLKRRGVVLTPAAAALEAVIERHCRAYPKAGKRDVGRSDLAI